MSWGHSRLSTDDPLVYHTGITPVPILVEVIFQGNIGDDLWIIPDYFYIIL